MGTSWILFYRFIHSFRTTLDGVPIIIPSVLCKDSRRLACGFYIKRKFDAREKIVINILLLIEWTVDFSYAHILTRVLGRFSAITFAIAVPHEPAPIMDICLTLFCFSGIVLSA